MNRSAGGIPFRPWPRPSHGVYVRPVTADNVYWEVAKIRSLIGDFPFIAVDTEYPGVIHHLPENLGRYDAAEARYKVLKANVDELHLLQLGITLCDGQGRLPVCPSPNGGVMEYAWQVNFADFDAAAGDHHAPSAVAFLRDQGLDFEWARRNGVTAKAFAREIHRSGLLTRSITWVTHGGLYDAAYLVKTITGGAPLPAARIDFIGAIGAYLGGKIFDVKYMVSLLGLEGSLGRVAQALNVPLVPARHLAGPNSVVTCHAFMELRRRFFPYDDVAHLSLALHLDGLRNAAADEANTNFLAARLQAYTTYIAWRQTCWQFDLLL